jgi:MFS family permease
MHIWYQGRSARNLDGMTALLTRSRAPRTPIEPTELGPAGVAVLLLGVFLPIVDFFVVNVALPTIDATLHASAPKLELVVAGYGTVYAALLVVGGRLGDALGRRRVFVAGLVGFTVTSLLCGVAPSIGTLIAFRIAQGATAALIVPQVLATFQATLDGPRRARALGLYGATAGVASVVGQVVGGLLVTADIAGTSWRPIFLVNVPVGVLALAVVGRFVPATRSENPASVDLPGTVLFAATLAALLIPITEGRTVGWAPWTWIVLAAAVALGVTTFAVERRTETSGGVPLLPPSLLRLRSMRNGLSLGLPFFLSFGGFMFVFALTVQDGLHADALHGGLAIAPFALAFLVGSLLTPRAIERYGRRALAAGAVLQTVGLAVLAWTVAAEWPHVPLLDLAPGLAVAGFGQAFVFGSLFRLVLADVPMHLAGIGGGVLVTLQQSGLALGVATLGTLYLSIGGGNGFATVLGIQCVIALIMALGSRTMPSLTTAGYSPGSSTTCIAASSALEA